MAGFDLKEGFYEEREVSEDELWDAVACVFTSKSKNDASYKFSFLKSILDNLKYVDDDLILTFDQLFTRFAELYWNLILVDYSQKSGQLNEKYTYRGQAPVRLPGFGAGSPKIFTSYCFKLLI